ncbi:MAG: hypothetical protein A2V70_14150 [Planctomycetes bacterium RBG_13_63_9]|nr:MAG: hypothetical protein A2V70_14150 [Planctomycetes bacterium RBG_13_63_9]
MSSRLNRRQFVRRTAVAAGAVAAGTAATGLHAPTIVRAASAGQWGDLVGRLVYDGEVPVRKKLKVDKDVECCGKFDIRDESLMVGDEGGLGNVYVYVRSSVVEICPELEERVADEKQVVLDNRDCIFKPHCMKIWYSKQSLHIVNSDPVAQNVAFTPLGDLAANIVLPAPPAEGAKADWTFKRKQRIPVPIACNYHPWESAYVLPLDSPYVDITQMDGTFRIAKLPLGELEFQFWKEKIGYLSTPQWVKGRLKMAIQPGVNDLGTIKIDPALVVEKT